MKLDIVEKMSRISWKLPEAATVRVKHAAATKRIGSTSTAGSVE